MLAKNEVNPNDPSLMTWTISRVSIGILQSTGPENIYESRKSKFDPLHQYLNDEDIDM